jgi:hypothetical protein
MRALLTFFAFGLSSAIAAPLQDRDLPKAIEKAKSVDKMLTLRLAAQPPKAVIEKCVNAWRPHLRDPDSAKAVSAYARVRINGGMTPPKVMRQVIINGRAKNGFGGYEVMIMGCDFTDDRIDLESVQFHKIMMQIDQADWLAESQLE